MAVNTCVSLLLLVAALSSCNGLTTKSSSLLQRDTTPFKRFQNVPPSTRLNFALGDIAQISDSVSSYSQLLADEGGYSNLSLYFTLALYVLTLPGLFSLVTRSVKVKTIQKDYDVAGPAVADAKPVKMIAAEVMAYFKALNYEVSTAEETITFKGVMGRSNSQAYFLTFCTFVGLGSLGLVLSILIPEVGSYAYALALLSPYAGFYYWNNAQREDLIQIRMETSDDETTVGITAQGGKEDLERFSKALELQERGKVYIEGMFKEGPAGGVEAAAVAAVAAVASEAAAAAPIAPETVEAYSMSEEE